MSYTPWRQVAAQHGVYATAGWMPEDIETLRPDWTEDRCLRFLQENEKYIVEAMVRDGWGAIEALLPTMKYEVQTTYDGQWSNEVGEPNVFGSEAEAEEAIAGLKALGDDWLEAEYRVEEVRS